jgi:protein-disulfide isomerase
MIDHARTDSVLQPDKAVDHIQGPTSAGVTLVEYGDFQCPSCAQAHAAMKVILAHFGYQLRFVYRHNPQRAAHPDAELAAEAAEAASAQGVFWPYYDLLFDHQQHLKENDLLDYARRLELDMARFQNEISDHVYLQRVQEHMQGAQYLGLRATPAFFVNNELIDVSFGLQHLHEAIDRVLRTR